MKFDDYQYQRVPLTPIPPEISSIPEKLCSAQSPEEFLELLKQADHFKRRLSTMYNICYIRHTINTQDEFYSAENDYYDQNMPSAEQLSTDPQPRNNEFSISGLGAQRAGRNLFS